MRSVIPDNLRTDPTALRRWLKDRIEAIEVGSIGGHADSFTTGWDRIDEALPGHGLRRGAIHEWFGLDRHAADPSSTGTRGPWTPPLLILSHLAARGQRVEHLDRFPHLAHRACNRVCGD